MESIYELMKAFNVIDLITFMVFMHVVLAPSLGVPPAGGNTGEENLINGFVHLDTWETLPLHMSHKHTS